MQAVLDKEFFSIIDTEDKAYWLGFLTADANIAVDDGRYAISLGLARKDRGHLVILKETLNATTSIRDYLSNNHPSTRFAIYSRKMVEDLGRLGVGPRKSKTCKPATITPSLERHYWRGIVDGDGYITGKEGKTCIGLCGNQYIVDGFRLFIAKSLQQTPATLHPTRTIWRVQYTGTRRASSVARILYNNAKISLDRKMILAKRCMSLIPKQRDLSYITLDLMNNLYQKYRKWKIVAKILNINYKDISRIRKSRSHLNDYSLKVQQPFFQSLESL